MYITILGRQPALGLAELERAYGNVRRFSRQVGVLDIPPDILRLGGSLKTGRIIMTLPVSDWRSVHSKIVQHYAAAWKTSDYKITLGISAYDIRVSTRDLQRTGLELKKRLKADGTSLRLIPNADAALNTATSHHNKLGLSSNKVELLIIRGDDRSVIVAESTGAQNITSLARRDQGRPKRDAFVGMLPPKLAQIMINLAAGQKTAEPSALTLLDPFCGTGVLLQEASLLGYRVYGSDLSEKMIDYSRVNLEWLSDTYNLTTPDFTLHHGDAMTARWQQPVDIVACETYLGQPFSAPPSPSKLREVRGNCDHIIGTFLRNISAQLMPGTQLCIGVPSWRSKDGSFTHLPLTQNIETYGFSRIPFKSINPRELLYYREDQVVARELLILEKT